MSEHGDAVALTRQLLACDTINPPGREAACAALLAAPLEAAGFATRAYELAPGRTSLVARLPGSAARPPLCFTGHLDTVPLGASPWRRDPFAGDRDGDRLYGRGASDMKSGVAALVCAACEVAPLPGRAAGLTLVLTAGEETGCEGARQLAARSGALGEAGALVVGEPTANAPWIAHKGCLRFALRTRGVAAHASTPERGRNAIVAAARAIAALEALDFGAASHPLLGDVTLNVGTIAGGSALNVVPDQACIGIDVRTLPGQDPGCVRARLAEAVGPEVEIDPLESAPAVETAADDPWVGEVFEAVASVRGARPEPAGARYFTDASFLTSAYGGVPTVILGPGEPEQAHVTDEYCLASRVEEAVALYAAIARRWCVPASGPLP